MGEETITSELTYHLRRWEPDAIDQIVATTFANVAVDLIRESISGRMTAIQDGKYTHVAIPNSNMGARKLGAPMLLSSVLG